MNKTKLPLYLFIGFAVAVTGCAATYQPLGLLGGYSDEQITENTFDVWYQGNGWTKPAELEKNLLRRCAEITVEKGYERFIILNATERSNASRSATIRMFRGPQPPFNAQIHEPKLYLAKATTKKPNRSKPGLTKSPPTATKGVDEPAAKPAAPSAKAAAKQPTTDTKAANNAPSKAATGKSK